MQKPTLRGYVWVFCMYLALTVNQIARYRTVIRPPHFERSIFFTLFPNVIAPAFVIFIFLSLLPVFRSGLVRAVLIFSALAFACNIVFALYQYEYISFGIPHWISSWAWFIATVFLGYRTDRLLKEHNKEIEAN
jgi:hypothetical protein